MPEKMLGNFKSFISRSILVIVDQANNNYTSTLFELTRRQRVIFGCVFLA